MVKASNRVQNNSQSGRQIESVDRSDTVRTDEVTFRGSARRKGDVGLVGEVQLGGDAEGLQVQEREVAHSEQRKICEEAQSRSLNSLLDILPQASGLGN